MHQDSTLRNLKCPRISVLALNPTWFRVTVSPCRFVPCPLIVKLFQNQRPLVRPMSVPLNTNRSVIVSTFPPPLMGEGTGGGGQDKHPFGPPSPSSPPTEGRGDWTPVISAFRSRYTSQAQGEGGGMKGDRKKMRVEQPTGANLIDLADVCRYSEI